MMNNLLERTIRLIVPCCAVLTVWSLNDVRADDVVGVAPSHVRVRTISATGDIKKDPLTIDPALQDLAKKFSDLPYAQFSLLSSQKVKVPLKKLQKVTLPEQQTLTLRLIYRNERKLGIWLEWMDTQGMQLLNSKIHLHCTEPVLAGTDNTDGSAQLLAVALED